MTVPQRHPGQYGLKAVLVGWGIAVVLAAYGVMRLGQWLNNGDWLDANPGLWLKTLPHWSGWHTALSVAAAMILLALIVLIALAFRRHHEKQEHIDAKAKLMGKGKELTLKAVQAKNQTAKYTSGASVGLRVGKAVATKKDLWADWRSTISMTMNPGAGKTSCYAIPWIIDAPGWAFGTANKPDLYLAVRHAREQKGRFWCFDPQGLADVEPTWLWNPLTYITGPGPDCGVDADSKATEMANIFADAARIMDSKTDGFFEPEGIGLMGGLLLAAAVAHRPITQVVHWVNNPGQGDEPLDILRNAGWELAAVNLDNAYQLNEETKRGVFANAKRVVNFLFNRRALAWMVCDGVDDHRPEFDPHQFVRSGGDTMICLSEEGSGSLGPLVAALTVAVVDAARTHAKQCPGGRIDPTGVFVLDEVANTAKIIKLPDWFSHFGSQGLFCVAIFQSRAQGRAAWGADGMQKLTDASTHRIYGRGIDEADLLRDLSVKVGQYDEPTWTTSHSSPSGILGGGHASKSTSAQYHRVPILEPADIHALPAWRAILTYGGGRPVLIEILPYMHHDPAMNELVKRSIELYGPRVAVTV